MQSHVVFISGLSSNKQIWNDQLRVLGKQIIPHCFETLAFNSIAEAAHLILKRAPAEFTLVGHSMGGLVALEMVQRAKHRINKLVLLNSFVALNKRLLQRQRLSLKRLAQGHFNTVMHDMAQQFSDRKTSIPKIYSMFVDSGEIAYKNQQQALLHSKDYLPELNSITCPTLIVYGKNDALFSLHDQLVMHHAISPSKLVTINNCGHFSLLEEPGTVTQLLRSFLG